MALRVTHHPREAWHAVRMVRAAFRRWATRTAFVRTDAGADRAAQVDPLPRASLVRGIVRQLVPVRAGLDHTQPACRRTSPGDVGGNGRRPADHRLAIAC